MIADYKKTQRPRRVGAMLLLAVLACIVLTNAYVAKADFEFGTPTNLGLGINSPSTELSANISTDGLSLFFASNRTPGTYQDFDLWVATREAKDEDWGAPVHLGDILNSRENEWSPFLSVDGLELYYAKGPWEYMDIVVSRRNGLSEPWGPPENLGPTVNSTAWDTGPSITSDGLELFFTSMRSGGFGGPDIYVTKRASTSDPWGPAVNLGPTINTAYGNLLYGEWSGSVSQDGLTLFFSSARPPGSVSNLDIWMTKRATREDEWCPPIRLPDTVNSSTVDAVASISADGSILYFCSYRPGGFGDTDFWEVPILPVVDFNSDGNIDTDDLLILIGYWGQDEPLCDIGPTPVGDGIVDIKDLEVFMSYWEKENMPEFQKKNYK